MTTLLQEAMEKLSLLPEERQNELGKMLIDVAAEDLHPYVLSDDERAAIEESLAQAQQGAYATDEEVAAMWRRFGL
ncbi:hypothetical protein A2673_01345 [Candidatus Kaiserbacteria bacterium RIFCSPHIGHO2_01_FULL_50_13]|uniref:Addiction module protein n=1 Tax=Candidatus Kaiserbacteria bacterium RIFCSPLOWO2_01_FULL_50_24 TaxID=1798507 RepID=A0A1F6ENA9_9BACT|nr:MAG: hypothetical protein A2673_01345 [Candidatus Kaiserbacteria bacterium RIFCSPHIGHO2_01_FULL_50_13]OGG75143.1 MAG: hypothetical protein A3A34_02190 [Candidatus Kaiserbacteria bacterium RIFCSPLOWO2_01_FULL_50_24]OGG81078.1 MAG: hypothetical protein A3H74_04120 [Candidatus Kaiserbacteria bacterium RIFCSPLOWO2_02_FULL_51_13]